MLVNNIPARSPAIYPVVTVKAVLDTLTGIYKFDETELHTLFDVPNTSWFIIQAITILPNVNDSDYYESIIETPKVEFIQSSTGHVWKTFPDKLAVLSSGNQSLISGWIESQREEEFKIRVSGEMKQVVGTIDVETIDFRIQVKAHRISDEKFQALLIGENYAR